MSKKASWKEIFGWAMFDFANSSYTTVIITVIWGDLFIRLVVGDGPDFRRGNLAFGIALFISYIFCVITGPIFGAIMDFSAAKKKFLFMSYMLTVVSTCSLFLVSPGMEVLGVVLLIISNFGFAAGESFVASFLPSLGEKEELGKISGIAWGIGYLGGLVSVILVGLLGSVEIENFERLRYVGPMTGIFFMVAAIPTFLWLREPGVAHGLPQGQSYLGVGFARLRQTLSEVKDFRDLGIFFVSLFFASAGLSIVISFAFTYGAQVIHWTDATKTMMFVITQFTALFGALGFGYLQDKIGAKITYMMTLVLWIIAIICIFLTDSIAASLGVKPEQAFLIVGCLAGAGLGATQSAGRALVGVFSPESKAGEFFGLWGLIGKLAAAIGVFGVAALQTQLGLRLAILF
ncbi:MAG TPA: MFS transporter, partial [Leptospiraceae bacterium]|nr:MFS transporter [Leptospiraceae bacterium]